MSKILKLDKHLMNMIAAGEVVERPATIVKELVENAIDAKAKNIKINIENGGIDLISVLDDGVGMSSEDALLAFERHATSKIVSEDDLFSIKTLGFRGEALPSIASVAKVDLTTNNQKDSTNVKMEYGKLIKNEKTASNVGTFISVSGLFHQTPARLKNMKSVNYEKAIILSNIEKFALAYPAISFTLLDNQKIIFKSTGNNDLIEVMYQIYGRDVAQSSFTFEAEDSDFKLEGVLVRPSETRANRNHIQIFINQRMVRSYRLTNNVIKAYQDFMFLDRFPIAVIKLSMDYQLVDVNVHPSKWEVRLAKELELSNFIEKSIYNALKQNMESVRVRRVNKKASVHQQLQFNDEVKPKTVDSHIIKDESHVYENQLPSSKNVDLTCENVRTDEDYDKFQQDNLKASTNDITTSEYQEDLSQLNVIGQLHGKYILAEDANALFIIDQHAAEERTNFEIINNKLANNIIETQQLLVAEHIEISQAYIPHLANMIMKLESFGLLVEMFSNNSVIAREVPLWLLDKDIKTFVLDILEYLYENKNISLADLRKDTIASKACKASIKFNRKLSMAEMQQVIINLSETKQPYHCPHGRPTLIKLTDKQLIKEFLR